MNAISMMTQEDESLYKEPWLPTLFKCLIQIEVIKNRKRRQSFLNNKSKELRIDTRSLLHKLDKLKGKERDDQIAEARKVTKAYMDTETNSDPDILAIIVELLNPELDELTEIMMKFVEMQLRRDEYIMTIYNKKYELLDAHRSIKQDFLTFYTQSLKLKRHSLQLVNYVNEKMVEDLKKRFLIFSTDLDTLLKRIFTKIGPGDQGKKVSSYYNMLIEKELVVIDAREFDLEIKAINEQNKNMKKTVVIHTENDDSGQIARKMYVNLCNEYLAGTENYTKRATVIGDMQLGEELLKLLL